MTNTDINTQTQCQNYRQSVAFYCNRIVAFTIKCTDTHTQCLSQLFSHCDVLLLPVKMHLITLKIT